jgi:hypothetical protein
LGESEGRGDVRNKLIFFKIFKEQRKSRCMKEMQAKSESILELYNMLQTEEKACML